jgi:hypothetical protein
MVNCREPSCPSIDAVSGRTRHTGCSRSTRHMAAFTAFATLIGLPAVRTTTSVKISGFCPYGTYTWSSWCSFSPKCFAFPTTPTIVAGWASSASMMRSCLPIDEPCGAILRASCSFTIATSGAPSRSPGEKSRPARRGIRIVSK